MSSVRSSSLADKLNRTRRMKHLSSLSPTPSVEPSKSNGSDKMESVPSITSSSGSVNQTPPQPPRTTVTRDPSPAPSKTERRKALAKAHMRQQTVNTIPAASSTASSSDEEKQSHQTPPPPPLQQQQQQSSTSSSTTTSLAEKRRRAMSRVATRMTTPTKPIVESYSNESSVVSSDHSEQQQPQQQPPSSKPATTFSSKYKITAKSLAIAAREEPPGGEKSKQQETEQQQQQSSNRDNSSASNNQSASHRLLNRYNSAGLASSRRASPSPARRITSDNSLKPAPPTDSRTKPTQTPSTQPSTTKATRSITAKNSTAVKAALAAARPRLRLGAESDAAATDPEEEDPTAARSSAASQKQFSNYEAQKRVTRSPSPAPGGRNTRSQFSFSKPQQHEDPKKSVAPPPPTTAKDNPSPALKYVPRKLNKSLLQEREKKDDGPTTGHEEASSAAAKNEAPVQQQRGIMMRKNNFHIASQEPESSHTVDTRNHNNNVNEEEPELSALAADQLAEEFQQEAEQEQQQQQSSPRISVSEMKNRFKGSSSPTPEYNQRGGGIVATHPVPPQPPGVMPKQQAMYSQRSPTPVTTSSQRSASPVAIISAAPPPKQSVTKPIPQSAEESSSNAAVPRQQPHSRYQQSTPQNPATTDSMNQPVGAFSSITDASLNKQNNSESTNHSQARSNHAVVGQQGNHFSYSQNHHLPPGPGGPPNGSVATAATGRRFAARAASPTPSHGSSVMGRQTPSRQLSHNLVVTQPVGGVPDFGPPPILSSPEPNVSSSHQDRYNGYEAGAAQETGSSTHNYTDNDVEPEPAVDPSDNHFDQSSPRNLQHLAAGRRNNRSSTQDQAVATGQAKQQYSTGPEAKYPGTYQRRYPSVDRRLSEERVVQSSQTGDGSSSKQQGQVKQPTQNPSRYPYGGRGQNQTPDTAGQTQHFKQDGHQMEVNRGRFLGGERRVREREELSLPTSSSVQITPSEYHQTPMEHIEKTQIPPLTDSRVTIETPEAVKVSKFKAQFEKPENVALHPDKTITTGKWAQSRMKAVDHPETQLEPTAQQLKNDDATRQMLESKTQNQFQGVRRQNRRDPQLQEQRIRSEHKIELNHEEADKEHHNGRQGNTDMNQTKPSIMTYWKSRIDGTTEVDASKSPSNNNRKWQGRQSKNTSQVEPPVVELSVEGNARAVIEVPEKQSVANMADRFKNIPPTAHMRSSGSPAPYGTSAQKEQRSPTARKSGGSVEANNFQNRRKNVPQPSPSSSRTPSPYGAPQELVKWPSPSPVKSEASTDIPKRKAIRPIDSSKTETENSPLSPGRARVLQEQARWRSQSPQVSEVPESTKLKPSFSKPSWVRPIETSSGQDTKEYAPVSPSRLSPRKAVTGNMNLQAQSGTPRSSDGIFAVDSQSPSRSSVRSRPQQPNYGRKYQDMDERSDASSGAPSMRRPLSPSSYPNRGIEHTSIERKHHISARESSIGTQSDRKSGVSENAEPNQRSPLRTTDRMSQGNNSNGFSNDNTTINSVGQKGHSRNAYLSSPPTLPAEARSKDAFQELQQKLLKRQHDIEVTSMASTPNVDNVSASAAAKVAASIMDSDNFGEEKKSAHEDDIAMSSQAVYTDSPRAFDIQMHQRYAESPKTLGVLAAQSIHAMDYDHVSYDMGDYSKSHSRSFDEAECNKYDSAIPDNMAVPPEFSRAVSSSYLLSRAQEAEQTEQSPVTENDESGLVFGNPETYGAAGGGIDCSPPTVADRARAIADWRGGITANPMPQVLSEHPENHRENIYGMSSYPGHKEPNDVQEQHEQQERSGRGASAVLRFWNQTSAEEMETADEFKDDDPAVADYLSDVPMSDIRDQLSKIEPKRLVSPSSTREPRHFRNRSDEQFSGTEKPVSPLKQEAGTEQKSSTAPDPFSPSAISELKTPSKASKGTFDTFWADNNEDSEANDAFVHKETFTKDDGFSKPSKPCDDGFGTADAFGQSGEEFASTHNNNSDFGGYPAFEKPTETKNQENMNDCFDSDGFPIGDGFSNNLPESSLRGAFGASEVSDNDGFPLDFGNPSGKDGFASKEIDPFFQPKQSSDLRASSNTDEFGFAVEPPAQDAFVGNPEPKQIAVSNKKYDGFESLNSGTKRDTFSGAFENRKNKKGSVELKRLNAGPRKADNGFDYKQDFFTGAEPRKGKTAQMDKKQDDTFVSSSNDDGFGTQFNPEQGQGPMCSGLESRNSGPVSVDGFDSYFGMVPVDTAFAQMENNSNAHHVMDFNSGFQAPQTKAQPSQGFRTEKKQSSKVNGGFGSGFEEMSNKNPDTDDLFLPSSSSSHKEDDNVSGSAQNYEANAHSSNNGEDHIILNHQKSNLSLEVYQRQQNTFDRLYAEDSTQEPIWSFETGIGTYFERERQENENTKNENEQATDLPRIDETPRPRSTAVEI